MLQRPKSPSIWSQLGSSAHIKVKGICILQSFIQEKD